ncbi:MAG: hypothetical protein ACK559_18340, partial [bacterium]
MRGARLDAQLEQHDGLGTHARRTAGRGQEVVGVAHTRVEPSVHQILRQQRRARPDRRLHDRQLPQTRRGDACLVRRDGQREVRHLRVQEVVLGRGAPHLEVRSQRRTEANRVRHLRAKVGRREREAEARGPRRGVERAVVLARRAAGDVVLHLVRPVHLALGRTER